MMSDPKKPAKIPNDDAKVTDGCGASKPGKPQTGAPSTDECPEGYPEKQPTDVPQEVPKRTHD
jgi:hypothetical protein